MFVLIWSPGVGKASFQERSIGYWFRQNLKASFGTYEGKDPAYRSRMYEHSLNAIKAMGTNALPYLLKEAFTPPRNSAVSSLSQKLLSVLPQSWSLPPSTSRDDISRHAVEVICECRPSAKYILPPLLVFLGGTNVELHTRALRILQKTDGPVDEAIPYLTRDLANSDPRIFSEAFGVLSDRSKAQNALPALIGYLKTTNPQLLYCTLSILRALGNDAEKAVPILEQIFLGATNWNTRCDLAETLTAIDNRQGQLVVPVLLEKFESETN